MFNDGARAPAVVGNKCQLSLSGLLVVNAHHGLAPVAHMMGPGVRVCSCVELPRWQYHRAQRAKCHVPVRAACQASNAPNPVNDAASAFSPEAAESRWTEALEPRGPFPGRASCARIPSKARVRLVVRQLCR